MGTGTSIGSSIASVNTQNSNAVNTGRKWGKTKQTRRNELDQTSAISLADKHQSTNYVHAFILLLVLIVKTDEVMLLWKRFQQLGPDKDGHVHRSVFANNPIYDSTFCRQVL